MMTIKWNFKKGFLSHKVLIIDKFQNSIQMLNNREDFSIAGKAILNRSIGYG